MTNPWFEPGGCGRVAGIGSALVDILVTVDDAFVADTSVPKGGMVYFDPPAIDRILQRAGASPQVVSGGAACNTIAGVARLGGETRFMGKRGNDEFGDHFEAELAKHAVETFLIKSTTPTGRVLSLITPDSQRTMLTYLGASAEMVPDEIPTAHFQGCAIVMIEGYLVYNPDMFAHAMHSAYQAGARIALDLASFTVVEDNHQAFQSMVRRYVDILIANEDEARVFTGRKDERDALHALADQVELAVVKLGAEGSLIASGDQVVSVPASGDGGVVDTTGAGDLWASGFLYGLVRGLPLDRCGRLASLCGYEVCRVIGASIPEAGWQRIRHKANVFPEESGRQEVL